MKIYLATHNKNKLREISQILPGWEVLAEDSAVEETEETFEGNARLKARAIAARHGDAWVLADDSGLEVEALGGAPGVRSARYAGVEENPTPANNALLLRNLAAVPEGKRGAQFTCAMVLVVPGGEEKVAIGHCRGRIAFEPAGANGFGYDPLFVPEGESCTFAELPAERKNEISHRGRALRQIAEALQNK